MDKIKLYKMINTVQEYEWGSPTAIPELTGLDNRDNKPKAELWMGSHGRGPSLLTDKTGEISLLQYIQENKIDSLGKELAGLYGDLPFLFKVLAAGSPLSIQVHPDKREAMSGFARENEQGIALDAFNRNYRDDNHKPEIICALTEFWAMRGFRPIDDIISRFEQFNLPSFAGEIEAFSGNRTSEGLEVFFSALMAMEGGRKIKFIEELIDACTGREEAEYKWVLRLYNTYREDAAIAAPLYLNLLKLNPGEALYLSAGELHAYLDGMGMELMASSDNVLRGGLTRKYIDRKELRKIVNFQGAKPEILKARPDGHCIEVYDTPCREFELSRITLNRDGDPYDTSTKGEVQILFLTEGEAEFLSPDGEVLRARKGESVFVPCRAVSWLVRGDAVIYRASVPKGEA